MGLSIWTLPSSLKVGGGNYAIRTDFRVVLGIFKYLNDSSYDDVSKMIIVLKSLYIDEIPHELYEEAYRKALDFFALGNASQSVTERHRKPDIMDWEQDGPLIISAINAVAGTDIRLMPTCHWWTFLGYYQEIGECTFSTILSIRDKRIRGKKLHDWEQQYMREHSDIVILNKQTEEEKAKAEADRKAIEAMLKGE